MVRFLTAGAVSLILLGCKTAPVRHIAQSPSVSVSQTGAVELAGDSPSPAKVGTSNTQNKITLPEGSKIDFNEKLGILAITLSKATDLSSNRVETHVDGPVAFVPDKGPTVGEENDAKSEFWIKMGLYASVFVGGAGAIFGLVRGWNLVMYGGVATLGAGLFGLFVQRHPMLLLVIGLGVALKFVGPLIWHTQLKHGQPDSTKNEGK